MIMRKSLKIVSVSTKAKTLPVADHYKVQKKHFTVNGYGTVEDVFQSITKILEEVK